MITGAIYANCGNEKIEAPCYLYKIAHLPDGQIFVHFAENAKSRFHAMNPTPIAIPPCNTLIPRDFRDRLGKTQH